MHADDIDRQLVEALRDRGLTVATAESLTAGLVSARIADVSGASEVLRGGVITYATETKSTLLGLDRSLLEHVVSREVAEAMASAACTILGATVGVATTGVAGPALLDGQPPGTAWIAVSTSKGCRSRLLHVPGDRSEVRAAVAEAALALALSVITGPGEQTGE